ncbi:helix-turn-helix domain-containing protein [Sphingomonas sp. BIUV-7]|uniref:Helix-turn-helix domain-containing protein n=1 Tax=Sphingomonas natans TaxID=3063330 RepID=A0ABT8Y667_9SPHN|nr:helix-turn-helix domain-containing protein [Sphingomonas sp. BIUV-7]MDO6413810.1 helix-turn-helix domain-containing protein [Sphingomonas sp. BIUV-7]
MSLAHKDVTAGEALPPAPDHAGCTRVAPILQRIGDKWSILIVMVLGGGPRRFNELKRQIGGISQRMLTLSLRGLERDGLVTRTVTPSIPPRVDYALTELGDSLRAPMQAIGMWADTHYETIQAARANFDRRAEAE